MRRQNSLPELPTRGVVQLHLDEAMLSHSESFSCRRCSSVLPAIFLSHNAPRCCVGLQRCSAPRGAPQPCGDLPPHTAWPLRRYGAHAPHHLYMYGWCMQSARPLMATLQAYTFGKWPISETEVFATSALAFAFVNLKPLVPGELHRSFW
jgi:hypothetical protein